MNINELKPIKTLNPFTKFCCTIGNLPSSYLDSMTYYEQLLWFCNFLEKTVIPTIDKNAEAVQELQNLFVELKNYVDNYFENLDVQNEINNKLDEMVESGELESIIAIYINNFKYLNVLDYGAKGNGEIDDTLAIQTTINEANKIGYSVYIPNGVYLISQLQILPNTIIKGQNINFTILKSISNNINNSLIFLDNANGKKCNFSNFTIDGNKENNTNLITGIKWLGNSYIGECFTEFNNIIVTNCSNNGIDIDGSNIINAKFLDLTTSYNNNYGFIILNSTDNMINHCQSYFNKKAGFYISGSNHRISNCKSNTNGRGDEFTIDIERTPPSAFVPTADLFPLDGKTYYTRSGSGYYDDPFEFTPFIGSSFQNGITYFELSVNYYKRYAGYEIYARRTIIQNCEAQDNFGDGLYLSANNTNITNFLGDGNGYLCVKNGQINDRISYSSIGLEQIYDGIHAYNCNTNNINGSFANFRYTQELGAFQRTGVCLKNCEFTNVNIVSSNQKSNNPIILKQLENINIISNGKEFEENYDLSRLPILTNGYYIRNNNDTNQSYLTRINNKVYMKLIIKNEDGTGTSLNTDIPITNLPKRFIPKKTLHPLITFSNTDGYLIDNDKISNANIYANNEGTLAIRGFTGNNNVSTILECQYDV